jgi:hypothetical protein
MNLYFLSLLEDKKREGHKKPLNKFIFDKSRDDISFHLGNNKDIIIMVDYLPEINRVIWSLSYPSYGTVGVIPKDKLNFYLLGSGLEFKKKNLFLRLTDHTLQNQF